METIQITDTSKQLEVKNACVDGSSFVNVSLAGTNFSDINMSGVKISNANMSYLEIEGAQLGGAYIHNIGMPPEGHPTYKPGAKMNTLKFENCNFTGSEITNCNLAGIHISDCNVKGMRINGYLLDDLMREYEKHK